MEVRYAVLLCTETGDIFPLGIEKTYSSALGLALTEIDATIDKYYSSTASVSSIKCRDAAQDTFEIEFTVDPPRSDKSITNKIVIFRAED